MSSSRVRLAACEPCRRSKLACDHEQPTCSRCRTRGQNALCTYRERPFRRRALRSRSKEIEESIPTETAASSPGLGDTSLPEVVTTSSARRYPNPGYLGISSHSTLFNQVSSGGESDPSSLPPASTRSRPGSPIHLLDNQVVTDRAIHALTRLDRIDIFKITPLVHLWLDKGTNLPLAEPFVSGCLESVKQWRQLLTSDSTIEAGDFGPESMGSIYVKALLANTRKSIVMHRGMSPQEFLAQMLEKNLRWESLGIFFIAAARAAYDISSFTPLYSTHEQRHRLIKTLTYIGDCCLETCIELDCLNDLQLVLQYENFIVHSQVDGDQSYHSWRRIGDVASSLFALGYHERVEGIDTPPFIIELRKACFARIYAADKSLAVFLGRPPRIVKDYCYFKIPSNLEDVWGISRDTTNRNSTRLFQACGNGEENGQVTHDVEPINYTADTRCSALFAFLKEDVLQLLRRGNLSIDERDKNKLRSRIDKQWDDLPAHFRLTTSLKDCQGGPFERDFLAGTRLDYLHVHFLLGLVSQGSISEPGDDLLKIATEMLSITVEVIILRDQLVNSGSCLIWKVAQYGLPAAGMISLALLNAVAGETMSHSRSKMIQALCTLVVEITTGAWIQAGEPNFALFARATRTIQSLLDSLLAARSPQTFSHDADAAWNPYANSQLWEFELDFWANLAEHPNLIEFSGR
ncbi:Ff.00g062860.m01.CDS01 [Fusarium sp. VM40]|nr:Ff.00g062860.m01.CDS01 [Fusarium sp. VM40]